MQCKVMPFAKLLLYNVIQWCSFWCGIVDVIIMIVAKTAAVAVVTITILVAVDAVRNSVYIAMM